MPSLNCIKILGNLKFLSHGLKLPIRFHSAGGIPVTQHYDQAFKPTDKIAIPRLIPPWFIPAEIPNKYYQDTCDKIGGDFKDLRPINHRLPPASSSPGPTAATDGSGGDKAPPDRASRCPW